MRKATRNMIFAYSAFQNAFGGVCPPRVISPATALVVSSPYGEWGATLGFLDALALTQTARPLFFQNSLHHSTAGFLCNQFGITGASVTVSQSEASDQAAWDTALSLLAAGPYEQCWLVSVQTKIQELPPSMQLFDRAVCAILRRGPALLQDAQEFHSLEVAQKLFMS
jgi:3-oxoacyl-(acyl-carrier-protein) synthase